MKTTSKRTYPTSWKDVPIVVDVPYVSILLGLHLFLGLEVLNS